MFKTPNASFLPSTIKYCKNYIAQRTNNAQNFLSQDVTTSLGAVDLATIWRKFRRAEPCRKAISHRALIKKQRRTDFEALLLEPHNSRVYMVQSSARI